MRAKGTPGRLILLAALCLTLAPAVSSQPSLASIDEMQISLGVRFERSRYLSRGAPPDELVVAYGKEFVDGFSGDNQLIFFKAGSAVVFAHKVYIDESFRSWLGPQTHSPRTPQFSVHANPDDGLHRVSTGLTNAIAHARNAGISGQWVAEVDPSGSHIVIFIYDEVKREAVVWLSQRGNSILVIPPVTWSKGEVENAITQLLDTPLGTSTYPLDQLYLGDRANVGLLRSAAQGQIHVAPRGDWKLLLDRGEVCTVPTTEFSSQQSMAAGPLGPNGVRPSIQDVARAIANPNGLVPRVDGLRQDPFIWLYK